MKNKRLIICVVALVLFLKTCSVSLDDDTKTGKTQEALKEAINSKSKK
jgi:protein involved in sex pheromone biosynthesis